MMNTDRSDTDTANLTTDTEAAFSMTTEASSLWRKQKLAIPEMTTTAKTIHIRLIWLNIDAIDIRQNTASGTTILQARWKDNTLDRLLKSSRGKDRSAENYFTPRLQLENLCSLLEESIWRTMVHNSRGQAVVTEHRLVTGTFKQNFTVTHFPFDIQSIKVRIKSSLSIGQVDLVMDRQRPSFIHDNAVSRTLCQDWIHFRHIEVEHVTRMSQYLDTDHTYPRLEASFKCARRSGRYLWPNVILLVVLLLFSLCVFAIPPTVAYVQYRLQLLVLILITIVICHLSYRQGTSKLHVVRPCCMDRYMMVVVLLLVGCGGWHGVSPLACAMSRQPDVYALVTVVSLVLLTHVALLVWLHTVPYRQRKLLVKRDSEMKKIQHNNSLPATPKQSRHQSRDTSYTSYSAASSDQDSVVENLL